MRWLFTAFFTFYGVIILSDVIGVLKPWEWGVSPSIHFLWGGLALLAIPMAVYCWYLLEQKPGENRSNS